MNTCPMISRRPLGSTVTRHWTELETPALLVDVDAARRNIELMATHAAEMPVAVRPHFKAHKSIDSPAFRSRPERLATRLPLSKRR